MADLTIRGAGIFGLSIAWVALSRGIKVQVIDPYGPGAGASGGIVGALQPHTPDAWNVKKQFQLESLLLAKTFWTDVEACSGLSSGYAPIGRLQPLATEKAIALAKERSRAALSVWKKNAFWQVVDDKTAGTWRPSSPTGLYIHDNLSAILHPRQAIKSLATAIRNQGGTIIENGNNQGKVLWATGVNGLADLSESLDRPIGNGVKGQAALLKHDATGSPQIFTDGLHIIPHLDGTIAVGSTSERSWENPTSTDEALEGIIDRASMAMPVLKDAQVIEHWAGIRPRAASRAPLLGNWPNRNGHFVANGGFKIGFGMAPKVAEVMVDFILDGKDLIPDEFRLT